MQQTITFKPDCCYEHEARDPLCLQPSKGRSQGETGIHSSSNPRTSTEPWRRPTSGAQKEVGDHKTCIYWCE